ncbi:pleckstrin homology domain-containing family G member 5-like, partial [Clarias magur]
MDGGMTKQKEAEKDKESDADGVFGQSAGGPISHQKAADNHKYHTVGHQKKKSKGRLVATLGKGAQTTKSRTPIQVLFNQGPAENIPIMEERGSAGGGHSQVELLKQTLQAFSVPNELNWSLGHGDKAEVLENSWTDIVPSHKSMAKTQRHQQEALWEFIYTEYIYINKLTVITDLVLAALEHVHQQGFLHEVSSAQLFSNIHSILDAHRRFWNEVLYPMLQDTRLTGQPFDPLKLEPGCLQFAERFSSYLDYCWEEERNMEFTRRQLETSPHFGVFLRWVETHPQCGRMRVGDMQAKPHQRITKYPLILKAILKATQDVNTQKKLNHMINSVSHFLDSINDYLLFKDDELALFAMSQKIEGYELQGMSEEINKHMQEFCRFDLTSPIRGMGPKVIRKLILGNTLKVRGRKDSKLEVVVLLFTDVLLLTKPIKKSGKHKVVRPPLSLERIHCAELKDGYSFALVEVSELGCPVSVYSVSTPSPESCTAWISTIHQAQEDLQSLRMKEETVKPEETSDEILEELNPFPPASLLNIKDTEEQSMYKSHFASTKFTAIQLEVEKQNLHNQDAHTHFLRKQMQNRDEELDDEHNAAQEPEARESSKNGHCEYNDVFNSPINERRVTWTRKLQSQKKFNALPQHDSLETSMPIGAHHLLVVGLKENSALSQSSRQFLLPSKFVPESSISDTQEQSQEPDLRQDSWPPQSAEGPLSESWTFTRMLKSPKIRRKRHINSQPSPVLDGSRRMSEDVTSSTSFPKSDSDFVKDHNIRRPSNTSSKSQDHLVLKMGSVKQNRGVFWNAPSQSLSESELPIEAQDQNSKKILKIKTQRSESLPDLQSSPLQSLLNRAKERERERGIAKAEGNHLGTNSTTPSRSYSEREKRAGTEEQEQFRTSWLDSYTGTEISVDSCSKDRKS